MQNLKPVVDSQPDITTIVHVPMYYGIIFEICEVDNHGIIIPFTYDCSTYTIDRVVKDTFEMYLRYRYRLVEKKVHLALFEFPALVAA